MALPTTISNVVFPAQNYFCGPFLSGGNVYAVLVLQGPPDTVRVVKATDPTSSFSPQDTTNEPSPGTAILSLWAFQDGTDLKIVTATTTGPEYRYHVFHMATDLWDGTLKNEGIEDVKTQPVSYAFSASVIIRSDDDVVMLYSGARDTIMGIDYHRVDYAVRVAGWTVGVNVAGNGLESTWFSGAAVLGASDKTHFFYQKQTAGDYEVYQRSLTSADSLGTQHAISTTAEPNVGWVPGVYYDAVGTERITAVYQNTNGIATSVIIENDGAPDTPDAASDVVAKRNTSSFYIVCCLALENGTTKKVHLLYADSATSDLWYDSNTNDGGWGTDTEELDAVTINRISSNVYNRSGNKLAYVYDDGGVVKYNEKDLGGALTLGLSGVAATG